MENCDLNSNHFKPKYCAIKYIFQIYGPPTTSQGFDILSLHSINLNFKQVFLCVTLLTSSCMSHPKHHSY